MQDFRDLKIWQLAHSLALKVYEATKSFPKEEVYGLTSQIRRASISVPTNIAEGCGRAGRAELAQFVCIAMGSASELEYELLLSKELGLMAEEAHAALEQELTQLKRMMNLFIQKLRTTQKAAATKSSRPTNNQ